MNEQNKGYNFDDDDLKLDDASALNPVTDEAPVDEFEASMMDNSFMQKFKTTYVWYVLMAVVIVVAGFIMYKVFFPSAPSTQPQNQSQSFNLQATPTNTTPNSVAAAQPVSSDMQTMINGLAQAEGQSMQTMVKQMQALQQSVTSALQNNNSNSQTITQLAQQMQQLNAKLDAYNQNLVQVSKGLQTTQTQLQLILAQSAQGASKLTLRAVVPGRAWLMDSKGDTTSVAVGDSLPYYGKVLSIDADAGTVTTSSGYVFQ